MTFDEWMCKQAPAPTTGHATPIAGIGLMISYDGVPRTFFTDTKAASPNPVIFDATGYPPKVGQT